MSCPTPDGSLRGSRHPDGDEGQVELVPEADILVTLTSLELDNLLEAQDQMSQELDRLRHGNTMAPELDMERSPRISRPCWVAFVYMVGLMSTSETENYIAALTIGGLSPVPVRLTMVEASTLNHYIGRTFGEFGVTVLATNGPESPDPYLRSGDIPGVVTRYQPECGLAVGVEQREVTRVSLVNFPEVSVRTFWGHASPWDTLQSGLQWLSDNNDGRATPVCNPPGLYPGRPGTSRVHGERSRRSHVSQIPGTRSTPTEYAASVVRWMAGTI